MKIRLCPVLPSMAFTAALLSAAGAGAQVLGGDETAVVVHADEGVQVQFPESPDKHPLQVFRVVPTDSTLFVPEGRELVLVCASDSRVSILGPQDVSFGGKLCSEGQALPLGSYQRLAPRAGIPMAAGQALVAVGAARSPEDPPLLLSPRNTNLLDPHPTLVWRRIPEALEVRISLPGLSQPLWLESKETACSLDRNWQDEVCTLAWPEGAKLIPGRPTFLEIGYRKEIAGPILKEKSSPRITLADPDEAGRVEATLTEIDSLPIRLEERLLLRGSVLAEGGFYAEALTTLLQHQEHYPTPEVAVVLGDLLQATGLETLALSRYQQALDMLPANPFAALPIEAAARFGRGHALFAIGHYDQAQDELTQAEKLFLQLGEDEAREKAQQAAKDAERHKKQEMQP